MSLKARIEAVIYAAEEPVTLAQLSVLFGEEALEQKQAREAAAAAEAEVLAAESAAIAEADAVEALEVTAEPASGGAEGQPAAAIEAASEEAEEAVAAEDQPEAAAEKPAEQTDAAEPSTEEASADAAEEEQAEDSSETGDDVTETEGETAELDEKKLARLREREIREELRRTLNELIEDYAKSERGMEIREVAGGYRVGTRPEYHDSVRTFVKSLKPPIKLSLQALETLAVIAYKQPITAPEVGEIRGVDSAGVIGSLIGRKLVTTAGRKQVIGRPILYKTTKEFLLRFGLKDLNELPSMEEFEKMAGELAENAESERLPFDQTQHAEHEAAENESEQAEVDETTESDEPVAVAAQAPSGRPRVVVAIPEHGGMIAVTDESTIYEDVPGVAVAVSELVEVVAVAAESGKIEEVVAVSAEVVEIEAVAEPAEATEAGEPEETPHG